MASFAAIAGATKSIERLLNRCFTSPPDALRPVPGRITRAFVARTEDFVERNGMRPFNPPALSIFVYRIDFNKTMRAAWSGVGHFDGRGHLPLDVHFLVTPWAENAEDEHRILGAAMECLESNPILSGPTLHPDPVVDWAPGETIQIAADEISTEAVMRTFDSLPTDYKLSVPYVARVVRIDSRVAHPDANATDVRIETGSTTP